MYSNEKRDLDEADRSLDDQMEILNEDMGILGGDLDAGLSLGIEPELEGENQNIDQWGGGADCHQQDSGLPGIQDCQEQSNSDHSDQQSG